MSVGSNGRALVIAEEPLEAAGLRLILESSDYRAFDVGDLERAERMVDDGRRDLVVWSCDHLTLELARAGARLRTLHPRAALCLLTRAADPGAVRTLLTGGSRGLALILRTSRPDVDEVVSLLDSLANGRGYVEPAVLDDLLDDASEPDHFAVLSATERQVLELIAEGYRNAEIARRLWKTEKAVEKSVARLFCKLGLEPGKFPHLDRRVVAASLFLQHGRTRTGRFDRAPHSPAGIAA